MSAYRGPGRLTPAAQRLDLLQARADRRRVATSEQTLGLGDRGWRRTDLKESAAKVAGAERERRLPRRGNAGAILFAAWRWHA